MCNLETENVDHYLAKCPIFYNQRQKYFDTHFTTLTEIIENNTIKNILKYVMETKRLEIPGAYVDPEDQDDGNVTDCLYGNN